MTESDESRTSAGVSRRTMVRGVAVGGLSLPLLAACGGGSSQSSGSGSSGSGSSGGGSKGKSGGTEVAVADVPVGGGKILGAQQVVVTQPTKGDFKAFTAICTHQGCTVGQVTGGKIICPCHGSEFSIKDGSPLTGPAQSPLAPKKVSVSGGQISVS